MPLVQNQAVLAANAVNDNVLAGSQWEFLPFDAFLEFGFRSGGGVGDLLVDVYSGQDVLVEAGAISAVSGIPIYPDDYTLNDVAGGGERIKIRVRNTTAGAITVYFALKITPL